MERKGNKAGEEIDGIINLRMQSRNNCNKRRYLTKRKKINILNRKEKEGRKME